MFLLDNKIYKETINILQGKLESVWESDAAYKKEIS